MAVPEHNLPSAARVGGIASQSAQRRCGAFRDIRHAGLGYIPASEAARSAPPTSACLITRVYVDFAVRQPRRSGFHRAGKPLFISVLISLSHSCSLYA